MRPHTEGLVLGLGTGFALTTVLVAFLVTWFDLAPAIKGRVQAENDRLQRENAALRSAIATASQIAAFGAVRLRTIGSGNIVAASVVLEGTTDGKTWMPIDNVREPEPK